MPFEKPREYATRLANQHGFTQSSINTNIFCLNCFSDLNNIHMNHPLTIYIEGDGHAWRSRCEISSDPTPLNPLALKLALLDPRPNVVYLARPCQYGSLGPECNPAIWTDERFSESVIASMNEAIHLLKKQYHANSIHLIGFSGGAAVVVLVAARRTDVASIITVAGDLDHEALSAYHHTTPLKRSLNPKRVAHQIAHIPQHHWIGDNDPVVPVFLSELFVNEIHPAPHVKRTLLPGVSHHDGWEAHWPEIIRNTPI